MTRNELLKQAAKAMKNSPTDKLVLALALARSEKRYDVAAAIQEEIDSRSMK